MNKPDDQKPEAELDLTALFADMEYKGMAIRGVLDGTVEFAVHDKATGADKAVHIPKGRFIRNLLKTSRELPELEKLRTRLAKIPAANGVSQSPLDIIDARMATLGEVMAGSDLDATKCYNTMVGISQAMGAISGHLNGILQGQEGDLTDKERSAAQFSMDHVNHFIPQFNRAVKASRSGLKLADTGPSRTSGSSATHTPLKPDQQ